MLRRVGVLTSGGDSPGMNASIRAVTRTALYHGLEVIGIRRGYEGLLEGDFVPMTRSTVGGILMHAARYCALQDARSSCAPRASTRAFLS